MSESEKRIERLAIRYWAFAAIPEEERGGYVNGFLAGIRDTLSALEKMNVLFILANGCGETDLAEDK